MSSSTRSIHLSQPVSVLIQPCAAETLQWDTQEIQLAIMRRAYELFEARNCEHGHDWEDWFQAESELLRAVPVVVSESPVALSVRANVLGFNVDELQVSVEPKKVTILGRKKVQAPKGETPVLEFYPDQILRTIELGPEIDTCGAVVEFQSGILKFEMPKAHPRPTAAGAA